MPLQNHVISEENVLRMYKALKQINKHYSPAKLRKQCGGNFGFSYEESLEMAYENVLMEAKHAIKGIRIKPKSLT